MLKPVRLSAAVAGLALTLGSLTVATAHAEDTPPPPAPCAQESAQVDKAEDALARVTAVFERQKERVAKAKVKVDKADNANERAKAKKQLAVAKSKRDEAKKAKKAQQQRLAKALERLAECEAEQTPPTPAP
ncbi:MAG: hypothetical protein ACI379_06840 [Nocardioides sp.]|uniref:hypothetical protein n=1 Tax=Nocardioides sp. TaxID=35761 RepID=UPI003F0B5058